MPDKRCGNGNGPEWSSRGACGLVSSPRAASSGHDLPAVRPIMSHIVPAAVRNRTKPSWRRPGPARSQRDEDEAVSWTGQGWPRLALADLALRRTHTPSPGGKTAVYVTTYQLTLTGTWTTSRERLNKREGERQRQCSAAVLLFLEACRAELLRRARAPAPTAAPATQGAVCT